MCKGKAERFEIVKTFLTSPQGSDLSRHMIEAGHAIFLLLTDNNGKWLFLQQRVTTDGGLQFNIPTTSFDPLNETLWEAAARLANDKCGLGICMLNEICAPFQMAPTFINSTCHVIEAQLAVRSLQKPLDSKAIERLEWINGKEVKKFLTHQLKDGTFKYGLPLDGRAQNALLIAEKLGLL